MNELKVPNGRSCVHSELPSRKKLAPVVSRSKTSSVTAPSLRRSVNTLNEFSQSAIEHLELRIEDRCIRREVDGLAFAVRQKRRHRAPFRCVVHRLDGERHAADVGEPRGIRDLEQKAGVGRAVLVLATHVPELAGIERRLGHRLRAWQYDRVGGIAAGGIVVELSPRRNGQDLDPQHADAVGIVAREVGRGQDAGVSSSSVIVTDEVVEGSSTFATGIVRLKRASGPSPIAGSSTSTLTE